jgi:hypothetical protein
MRKAKRDMVRQLRTLIRLSLEGLRDFSYRASYVGSVVAVLAVPLLLVRRRRIGLEKLLFLAAFAFLLIRTCYRIRDAIPPWDFRVFHTAGLTLRAGGDPYGNAYLILPYPPVSLPFFVLFGSFSFQFAGKIWLACNVAIAAVMFVFCRRVVPDGEHSSRREALPWAVAACLLLSEAALFGLDAGTMCTWTTAWIYAALWCRHRGRPLFAGVALAMAAVKIATMIPFLLLFLRRGERLAWLSTGVTGLALCLLSSSPRELIERSERTLQNIEIMQGPGMVNDYTFAGPFHDDIISFGHWAYCLGLRNRTVNAALQMTLVLTIGALLCGDFYLRRVPPHAEIQIALVCVYSCLFLYHRMYDTILLAFPLLLCSERARRESGWQRLAYSLTVIGFLLILNMPRGKPLHDLAGWSITAGIPGRLVQVIVLPFAVWVLLFALVVIRFGDSRCRQVFITND